MTLVQVAACLLDQRSQLPSGANIPTGDNSPWGNNSANNLAKILDPPLWPRSLQNLIVHWKCSLYKIKSFANFTFKILPKIWWGKQRKPFFTGFSPLAPFRHFLMLILMIEYPERQTFPKIRNPPKIDLQCLKALNAKTTLQGKVQKRSVRFPLLHKEHREKWSPRPSPSLAKEGPGPTPGGVPDPSPEGKKFQHFWHFLFTEKAFKTSLKMLQVKMQMPLSRCGVPHLSPVTCHLGSGESINGWCGRGPKRWCWNLTGNCGLPSNWLIYLETNSHPRNSPFPPFPFQKFGLQRSPASGQQIKKKGKQHANPHFCLFP